MKLNFIYIKKIFYDLSLFYRREKKYNFSKLPGSFFKIKICWLYLWTLFLFIPGFFSGWAEPSLQKRAENRSVFGEARGNHDLKNSGLYLFGL